MAKKSSQPTKPAEPRELQEIVREVAVYPEEAYEFVETGLQYAVKRLGRSEAALKDRHVSGQELSLGLREFAWHRWGLLARSVLARWNITSTQDFGRIVYALIEGGLLMKTDEDRIEDFRNVYDFKTLESEYRIGAGAAVKGVA